MKRQPEIIEFEGHKYHLSGQYYRRQMWGSPGPASLHRAIWESLNGPIPEGHDIHHRDGDPFNNEPANLESIARTDHKRAHALERHAAGTLAPPSKECLGSASEWHSSPEGLAWHAEHGRKTWDTRLWSEVPCQQCGQVFSTPYPTRAKWCHLNCKMENLRQRRGAQTGTRPDRKKPRPLEGKRRPAM